MAARLRLASRPTLEDLETTQSQQAIQSPSLHLPQAKSPVQGDRLPREHYHVAQILYAKDAYAAYPAWKRALVTSVYLPLFRFFHSWLGLFPPTRMEPDGTYSWLIHQGCFLSRAEANTDAARYPHGYVVPNVPLGRSLTADVAKESSIYFAKNKEEPAICAPLMEAQEELRKLKADVRSLRTI